VRAAGVKTVGGPVGPLELPEPPTPGLDEILIEVEAAGVGNWDRFVQQGDWDVGISAPMALGVEAAGRVIAAGRAARMRPGSEVLVYCVPLRHQGAWAERLLVAVGSAAFKPTGTSWEEAAAFRDSRSWPPCDHHRRSAEAGAGHLGRRRVCPCRRRAAGRARGITRRRSASSPRRRRLHARARVRGAREGRLRESRWRGRAAPVGLLVTP